jgi:uncharacterized membrane protein
LTEATTPAAGDAPPFDDRPTDLEILIPKMLRWGLRVSVALLALGVLVRLAAGPHDGPPVSLFTLPQALLALDPQGLMGLGVLVLILTPIARVFASLGYFAKAGDRPYIALTLIVLLNLALAAAVGAV